jgi:hypothetical protein
MGFWPDANKEFNIWINACAVCRQFRSLGQMALTRSVLSTGHDFLRLPYSDVVVDCQGPFARSESGKAHVASYCCAFLGAPKVEPTENLQAGSFSRALVACVLRARRVPDVVRTDRGPEFTSTAAREFFALCDAKQFYGAGFAPRHRANIRSRSPRDLFLFVRSAKRSPKNETRWRQSLSACAMPRFKSRQVTPYCRSRMSLWRLSWYIGGRRRLIVSYRVFSNDVKLIWHLRGKLERNQHCHVRVLLPGEVVFRKMPPKARPPKHLLGGPSRGPYLVGAP